jgi:hypothetical protein
VARYERARETPPVHHILPGVVFFYSGRNRTLLSGVIHRSIRTRKSVQQAVRIQPRGWSAGLYAPWHCTPVSPWLGVLMEPLPA